MRPLLLAIGLLILPIGWSNQARAYDGHWPWSSIDAPYWPDYRTPAQPVGENCVRWNWQERSYYNYCGDRGYFARPTREVLRVRD